MPKNESVPTTKSMSEDDRESEGLVAIISSVEVAVFTQKKPPSTHIQVTIDEGPSQKSIVIKRSANPKWLEGDENMTFSGLRPSSILKLQLFQQSRNPFKSTSRLVGEFEGNIVSLVAEDNVGVAFDMKPYDPSTPLIKLSICGGSTKYAIPTLARHGQLTPPSVLGTSASTCRGLIPPKRNILFSFILALNLGGSVG
ncbi:uncharacterized protein STEHIDRAFT_124375 [Stereum hirsutum FP-91666 SS1]|uniref:uncharacterized protein n=1 Tax=Stereum hirsutum (strain FP-91666) TaxID=721885 RepID=UPI0004449CC7|nr:uncharacterized protein STEHIDRAFT_124375 [Stereum hirsutum FP-91666 SS1]EIM83069.1 hypothetical protein STEHIDRAFT_124375 [Stereum hirsutum FP-91666 SS1]